MRTFCLIASQPEDQLGERGFCEVLLHIVPQEKWGLNNPAVSECMCEFSL